ncbi:MULTISPECIES: Spy/CpxP family protein refolding chaperone [unclassified Coleofasciculus]|uniref:Spy/CpxP family protein refolding chaperone n=1 Tax=Cyanophyceae TaxID=3028117 RepID=UPI001686F7F7|nr:MULTISPECIES: Spy/CpxP family protein refolding chaperone [unclassified Coleofasciculus]MBD1880306.1 Spy/CpxP family protein refolding chaperone [Coleofasciculus sp. FACHB-T130]MBD1902355.1 Spy/CpxP family protein refolding chaperone [Coleofasciculus sp. FACHB-125]MBD1942234.1 Spy/CpxP family protein refolding chaperone [Coleofasciculus sp. FACHB-712]MBD2086575.1 Spy/CpxP family protein refolding chaperone [Coleofasciculus sp. FACHB-542]
MSLNRISLLAVLILSIGSAVALADPNPQSSQTIAQNSPGARPQRGNKDGLLQQLNLTPQQMQQMQAIRQKYRTQIAPRQQTLRQARQELATLMNSTASASQIRSKNQQVEELQQQLQKLRFESMLEMREVMTPEQRAKFVQLMQQRRQQKGQRAGKNRGQGFPGSLERNF